MHLYAFIAIFVPKLVAMVTTLCPLCTEVSQMKFRWRKPYLKTKLCMDLSLTTEVMVIFVIFLAYFGQNLVAIRGVATAGDTGDASPVRRTMSPTSK